MTKLFIFIPTFNRPEALRNQLAAVCPQVAANPESVRLLVCDNASSKKISDDIIQKYSQYPNIEFRQNAGNIGGNGNIALGFIFARPDEFLWILSDNDIIKDTAIKYILANLDSKIDFYCFNDYFTTPTELKYSIEDGWKNLQNWRVSLISDALYNMNTVKESIADAFFYHNTSFPHMAVAYSAIRRKKQVTFRFLPRTETDGHEYDSTECSTDYSLARIGVPLLASLFPKEQARAFTLEWISLNGINLFRFKETHYHLYIQSKVTLKYYGGWRARLMLFKSWVIHVPSTPIWKVWRKVVESVKKKMSPTTQDKLRSILKSVHK